MPRIPIDMGSAPEIGQKPLIPPPPPPLPKTDEEDKQAGQVEGELAFPPKTSELEETSLTPPEAAELEMLPNDDIDKLCARYLSKVDGRWGRQRKIEELLIAGVTGREEP